jgi:hypothetical protein
MRTYLAVVSAALASLLTIGCSRAPDNYASSCSAPREHWGREKDGIGHLRTVQPIYVASDGSTLWNKVVVSDATLRHYMSVMSAMNPEPQAVLDIAPTAACNRVEAVRTIMDAAPMCKGPQSLCSEGWNWRQWPELGGP